MSFTPETLQTFLLEQIPLTSAMGVRVLDYDGQHLELAAPLAPNHNDKGTAFAGSISTLATVCGWAALMVWAKAHHGACQVAIAHADIQYKKPILTDFRARAVLPQGDALAQLDKALSHKRRARAQLRIDVLDDHGVAVTQVAEYAVWRMDK